MGDLQPRVEKLRGYNLSSSTLFPPCPHPEDLTHQGISMCFCQSKDFPLGHNSLVLRAEEGAVVSTPQPGQGPAASCNVPFHKICWPQGAVLLPCCHYRVGTELVRARTGGGGKLPQATLCRSRLAPPLSLPSLCSPHQLMPFSALQQFHFCVSFLQHLHGQVWLTDPAVHVNPALTETGVDAYFRNWVYL